MEYGNITRCKQTLRIMSEDQTMYVKGQTGLNIKFPISIIKKSSQASKVASDLFMSGHRS